MIIEGTYKIDDCTVINPTLSIYDMGRSLSEEITIAQVNIQDENDGATFTIKDESEPIEWTTEQSFLWVVEQLQKYKI